MSFLEVGKLYRYRATKLRWFRDPWGQVFDSFHHGQCGLLLEYAECVWDEHMKKLGMVQLLEDAVWWAGRRQAGAHGCGLSFLIGQKVVHEFVVDTNGPASHLLAQLLEKIETKE